MSYHYTLGKEKFTLPQAWGELTVRSFLRLKYEWNQDDITEMLSILTGLPKRTWFNASANDFDAKVTPALGWINDKIDFSQLPRPEKIIIGAKTVTVNYNLEVKAARCKIMLQKAMQKSTQETGDILKAIPDALVIYLFDEYYGHSCYADTDEKMNIINQQEEALKELCWNMRIDHAYPVAAFFLRKFFGFTNSSRSTSRLSRQTKRLKPALRS